MEYQYIVNPQTNRKCRVDSMLGKRIIRNYKQVLRGGARNDDDGIDSKPQSRGDLDRGLAGARGFLGQLDAERERRMKDMTPQQRERYLAQLAADRADRQRRGVGPAPVPQWMKDMAKKQKDGGGKSYRRRHNY